jgi:hypothetical protein
MDSDSDDNEEMNKEVKKSGNNLILIILVILLVIVWRILTGTIQPDSLLNWNTNGNFIEEIKKFILTKYDWLIGICLILLAGILLNRSNRQWFEQEKLRRQKMEEEKAKIEENNEDIIN